MLLINIDHFASTHIKYEYSSQAKSAYRKNALPSRGKTNQRGVKREEEQHPAQQTVNIVAGGDSIISDVS